jgi:hypothetical protein
MSRARETVTTAALGLLLGFVLSRIGFSSWDEVHAMFTFSDLRMFLSFAVGVVMLGLGWLFIARTTGATWSPRRLHQGTIVGGIVFGAGWAIGGACPGIALVQLGEGQLGAAVTLLGMLAGNWIYAAVHERFFRWPTEGCGDQ